MGWELETWEARKPLAFAVNEMRKEKREENPKWERKTPKGKKTQFLWPYGKGFISNVI